MSDEHAAVDDDDRTRHFQLMAGDLCKAAAVAGLRVEVETVGGDVFEGVASCRPGDPEQILRIGDVEIIDRDVRSIKATGPVG